MTHAYRAPSHPGMGYPGFVDPKPPARFRAPAEADGAVVRALYAKQVPAIMEIEAEGRREGIAEGIAALCEVLGIPLDAERRAAMQGLDAAGLRAVLRTLRTERRWS